MKTAEKNESHPLFPIIPPIADADPAMRQPETVRIPTAMLVVRHGDKLTVSFPTLETTNLLVGHKMATGITREDTIYRDGVARSLGWGLQGGLVCEPQARVFDLGKDGVPRPGQEFAFEHRMTMFETDEPAQHMWSPTSGQHYKVLWSRTFREIVH